MKKVREIIISLAAVIAGFLMATPALASAAPLDLAATTSTGAVCEGIGATNGGSGCSATGTANLNSIARFVIGLLSVIAGFAAVVMIIVAGLQYVMSAGDASKVSSAKNALMYAVIGLVIVAVAQFIVRFVLAKTT